LLVRRHQCRLTHRRQDRRKVDARSREHLHQLRLAHRGRVDAAQGRALLLSDGGHPDGSPRLVLLLLDAADAGRDGRARSRARGLLLPDDDGRARGAAQKHRLVGERLSLFFLCDSIDGSAGVVD
jgi:hypothetical protein